MKLRTVSNKFLVMLYLGGLGNGVCLYHFFGKKGESIMRKFMFDEEESALQGPYKARGNQIFKYGIPLSSPVVTYYKNHAMHYDWAKKIPLWVAEHLTDWNLIGRAHAGGQDFEPDPEVPAMFSARNDDYRGSGWSRGAMSPAGNHRIDQQAMNESFFLTNTLPQNQENLSVFWSRFELFCRDLTRKYSDVRVISGPLFLPNGEESVTIKRDGRDVTISQKYVKYPVIGESKVAVPTHLYKVILANETNKGPAHVGAFIVPNEPIARNQQLSQFQVPLEQIEEGVGCELAPRLKKDKARNLCDNDGCKMMSFETFELHYISRKLECASSIQMLENAWSEVSKKGLHVDANLQNQYEAKKLELQKRATGL